MLQSVGVLSLILIASVTVVPPQDGEAVLHNPDMGWVLYENYPIDQRKNGTSTLLTLPDENFDGVDTVAVMFSWADVEPGRHVLRIGLIDGDRPIALPLKDDDGKTYPIGPISCER